MVLSYNTLMQYGPKMIDPFEPNLVNPASIDIRIGDNFWFEAQSGEMYEDFLIRRDELTIGPGEFMLVATLEKFTIPSNLVMELKLKSSMARLGFNHSLAFWFDPGWNGRGTMEISNLRRYESLKLRRGQPFAQVVFHQLDSSSEKLYNGKYQNAIEAELAK